MIWGIIMENKPLEMVEPLTENEIVAVAHASFGKAVRVISYTEVRGGLFNACYRLLLANPELDVILRVAPSAVDRMLEYEKTMMLREPMIYELMRNAGVPVPEVLAVDGSHTVVPRDYIFLRRVPGVNMEHPSVPHETRGYLREQLGSLLGLIHSVKNSVFGWPGLTGGSEKWGDVFGSILEEVIARCVEAEIISPDVQCKLIRQMSNLHSVFNLCSEPCLTHNDIWNPNILVRGNGEWRIVAIVDVDRAMFADREFESALWWNTTLEFFQGYGRKLDPSEEALIRRKFYALYVNLWQAFAFKVQISRPAWCEEFRKSALELIARM